MSTRMPKLSKGRKRFPKVIGIKAIADLSILLLHKHIAYQFLCWIGLIKPVSNNLWISSLICTSSSTLKFLGACLIGLILSWCVTNYGKSWKLSICPCKNIFKCFQEIKKYLLQINRQTSSYEYRLSLTSFFYQINFNQLFVLVLKTIL